MLQADPLPVGALAEKFHGLLYAHGREFHFRVVPFAQLELHGLVDVLNRIRARGANNFLNR